MNKKLTFAFALFSAVSIFSNELTIPQQQIVLQEPKSVSVDSFRTLEADRRDINKKGSIYFRAMTDAEPAQGSEIFPGFGIGYRTSYSNSGFDISANYSFTKGEHGHKLWTAPKVSYLHYVSPKSDQSLYGGAGLAWGGTYSNAIAGQHSRFQGLIPHLTLGYELLRNSMIFSFTEFTLSQPLFPSKQLGVRPGMIGELSLGAGF